MSTPYSGIQRWSNPSIAVEGELYRRRANAMRAMLKHARIIIKHSHGKRDYRKGLKAMNLILSGYMTLTALSDNPDTNRKAFDLIREGRAILAGKNNQNYVSPYSLSEIEHRLAYYGTAGVFGYTSSTMARLAQYA